jgi:inorganic pyrophosphatase
VIKVLIQTARGSVQRRIYDERTLEYKETRTGNIPYLYPYGFIPGTCSADGDCVDCYIISHDSLAAGSIVECEPIGLLEQDEDGEIDHKVLAAMLGQSVELNEMLLEQLQSFIQTIFAAYPDMTVKVGPILSRDVALDHIEAHRSQ